MAASCRLNIFIPNKNIGNHRLYGCILVVDSDIMYQSRVA